MTKKEIAFVHIYGILIGSMFSLLLLKALVNQYGFFSYFFLFPSICGGGITGYILGIAFTQIVWDKYVNKKEKRLVGEKLTMN